MKTKKYDWVCIYEKSSVNSLLRSHQRRRPKNTAVLDSLVLLRATRVSLVLILPLPASQNRFHPRKTRNRRTLSVLNAFHFRVGHSVFVVNWNVLFVDLRGTVDCSIDLSFHFAQNSFEIRFELPPLRMDETLIKPIRNSSELSVHDIVLDHDILGIIIKALRTIFYFLDVKLTFLNLLSHLFILLLKFLLSHLYVSYHHLSFLLLRLVQDHQLVVFHFELHIGSISTNFQTFFSGYFGLLSQQLSHGLLLLHQRILVFVELLLNDLLFFQFFEIEDNVMFQVFDLFVLIPVLLHLFDLFQRFIDLVHIH